MKTTTMAKDVMNSKFGEWLRQQGVSTVLLFLIFYAVWSGLPYVLDRIDKQVDKITESQERNIEKMVETFNEDQQRDDQLIKALMQSNGIQSSSYGHE